MKTNAFGEPVIQPGDDVLAIWHDRHMPEDDPVLTARFIEHDPVFNWTATISDDLGTEMEAHDFPDRATLVAFLADQGIEIEDE